MRIIRTKYQRLGLASIVMAAVFVIVSIAFANSTTNWSFFNAANYTVSDADKAEVAGGVAKLVAFDQTDDDNSAAGFAGGTHNATQWDGANGWVKIDTGATTNALPDDASNTGWFDMTGNTLLMHLDESPADDGDTISNSSGQGNDGSFTTGDGVTDKSAPGKVGTAFSLDGVTGAANDIVVGPASNDITGDNLQTITIAAWVKSITADFSYLVSLKRSASNSTLISLTMNQGAVGNLGFLTRNNANTSHTYLNHAGAYNDGTWHHIAAVIDGMTRTLYVDGQPVATDNDGIQSVTGNSAPFTVGGFADNYGSLEFEGDIDEVAVWTRALTDDDIEDIYDRQSSGGTAYFDSRVMDATIVGTWDEISWIPQHPYQKELPDNAGVESGYPAGNADMTENILLMHMNETTGEIIDSSGQGNNGTVHGDVTYGVDGKFNTALEFDGNGDYIELTGLGVDISAGGHNTVEFWMYWEGDDSQMPFGWDEAYDLWLRNGCFGFNTGQGNVFGISSAGLEDRWVHVAAVFYNGVPSETESAIYIDGVKKTISACLGSTTASRSATTSAQISGWAYGGGYHFNGDFDEFAIYDRALTDTEVMDHYKRGALRMKFQVRSCDDAACDTEEFIGPDGTNSTYYSELTNDSTTTPTFALVGVDDNRYFQYRATFETDDDLISPELTSAAAGPDHYSTENPTVTTKNGVGFYGFSSFTQTLGAGNAGTVRYQISNDGSTWYYHDGSSWTSGSGYAQTNTASEISTNASTFVDEIGIGSLFVKAFLHSDGSQQVELDQIDLAYSSQPSGVVAEAGAERFVVSGRSVQLAGSASGSVEPYRYNWAIASGEGSLSNETSTAPTYSAPASASSQDVVIYLTVQDDYGQRDTDSVTIHLLETSGGAVIVDTVAGSAGSAIVYETVADEDEDTSLRNLVVGSATIQLPVDSDEYALAFTSDDRLVIGLPGDNGTAGRVYVFGQAVGSLTGTIDMTEVADTKVEIGSVADFDVTREVMAAKADALSDLMEISGNQSGDLFGQYLAAGDIDGDGLDEIVIVAPGAGSFGIAYIHDSNGALEGMLVGTAAYPMNSVMIANYLSSTAGDIIFGPDNLALNMNLTQGMIASPATISSAAILDGSADFSGVTVLDDASVDSLAGTGGNYQSMANADVDGDGQSDLLLGANDGTAYIFYGAQTAGADLAMGDADVVITGGTAADSFGRMIATGDVNGDGRTDIVIGAPDAGSAGQGAIYVILGDTIQPATIDVPTSANVMFVAGESASDGIGGDIALADGSGDGADEIYTIKAATDVYVIDLMGDFVGTIEGEGVDDAEEAAGGSGGCHVGRGEAAAAPAIAMMSALLAISLMARRRRKKGSLSS